MRLIHALLVTIAPALVAACTMPDSRTRYAPGTSPAEPFEDTSTETPRCPAGTHEVRAEPGPWQDAPPRHCVPDELPDKEQSP
jgi:hypothetical protein